MREALNATLRERLASDPRVFLLGEDIEAPKGDVFGVTRGLSTAFPGRVRNSALSESTIVGTCIGRALAGQRPVAFIQFADFLPLAWNQIVSELGSMYWRTNGGWQCPVIVMVTCGGYKPGLGPFHAQTMAAHTPGIDVVMPSTAADAAGLLNAVFESGRPTLFFYPKACLNLTGQTTSADVVRQFVPLGSARVVCPGSDVTLVSWGAPLQQCRQAVELLASANIQVELIDLRSLSPWDESAVLRSVRQTRRLVVVHEDNVTCGFGAEVLARVAEQCDVPVTMRRLARPDVYVPCHFGSQLEVLPSCRSIVTTIADLCGFNVRWSTPPAEHSGLTAIHTIGSGPADESVVVVALNVREGDRVSLGDVVAELEASKSVIELAATISGTVEQVLVRNGDTVLVGQPVLMVRTSDAEVDSRPKPVTKEILGQPIFERRTGECGTIAPEVIANAATKGTTPSTNEPQKYAESEGDISMHLSAKIYLSRPACALGSRVVTTAELAANIPGWTADEALKRTGVETRNWIGENEDTVSLAIAATSRLLDRLGNNLPPISLIACSTTSPKDATPSVACQVATTFADRLVLSPNFYAYDFNAACSGYLYGLRLAWDHLQSDSDSAVLLLTSEGISPIVNREDATTCFLFGDAASATLIVNSQRRNCTLAMSRPHCVATPDPSQAIWGPCSGAPGYMTMDGITVARTAYKGMSSTLQRAAVESGTDVKQLAALLPHPGSKRILQNVAEFLKFNTDRVWHTLADTGNTSSTSIPLALDRFWERLALNQPLGFTAFGAGFTSAAAIGQLIGEPHHV